LKAQFTIDDHGIRGQQWPFVDKLGGVDFGRPFALVFCFLFVMFFFLLVGVPDTRTALHFAPGQLQTGNVVGEHA
jgi:hypothetical protein